MKRTLLVLAILSATALSGCAAVRAGKAVVTMITPKTVMDSTADVMAQPTERIYFVPFRAHSLGFDSPDACIYDTVITRYVRDWDEISDEGRAIFKADPDKPIGYGLMAYRERCPGQQPKDVFLTVQWRLPMVMRSYVVQEGERVDAADYFVTPAADRPQWVPQAIKLIQAQADKHPQAQDFLEHVQADGMPKPLPK